MSPQEVKKCTHIFLYEGAQMPPPPQSLKPRFNSPYVQINVAF